MNAKNRELIEVEKLLTDHVSRFEEKFTSQGKLPHDKDWRPGRFAVRDVVIGLNVIRLNQMDNVLEVDVCLTEDGFDDYVGTRVVIIDLLSEAYKCGSTMGIRFTKNFGKEHTRVYPKIYDLAADLGVPLHHAKEGYITPKESRQLYLALTGFSPEATRRIMELSVANVVSPERCCYMVHHLTWTLPEMESILLGSEWPERIILGNVSPGDYQLYLDTVIRARSAILGGFLDRKLQLKETEVDGVVVDLDSSERRFVVSFDPRFFAKAYECEEDTPIPWTARKDWTVPAGHRIVAMVRARDWPDFEARFARDVQAAVQMVNEYGSKRTTHFFLLVPRNVLELPEETFEGYQVALKEAGVILMVCPESVSLLDADAIKRLGESHVMRLDVTSDEANTQLVPLPPVSWYNTSEVTWVALPPDLTIGTLALDGLVAQGLYDENEIARGVNKANVEKRYHLVCDRMQFLACRALSSGKRYPQVTIPSHLHTIVAIAGLAPEVAHTNRLLSTFVPAEQLPGQIAALEEMLTHFSGDVGDIRAFIKFLSKAEEKGYTVLCVQDKHGERIESNSSIEVIEPSADADVQNAFRRLFVPDNINDFAGKEFDEVVTIQVWNAVRLAVKGRANGVNFTEVPHTIVTKTLRYFSYKRPEDIKGVVMVNIVYTDGSQARPFPVFALSRRSDAEIAELRSGKLYRIGMMSCRHPDMDPLVDQYWFHNMEVSVSGRPQAETDEFCYQLTRTKLAEIRENGAPIRFEYYQTGLQPAVVGFWRAVVEFLAAGNGQPPVLEVVPQFYRSSRNKDGSWREWYEKGSSWS